MPNPTNNEGSANGIQGVWDDWEYKLAGPRDSNNNDSNNNNDNNNSRLGKTKSLTWL